MKNTIAMSEAERRDMWRRRLYMILPLISLSLLLLLWLHVSGDDPNSRFPSPKATWDRFIQIMNRPVRGLNIFGHVFASLKRVGAALVLAWIFGVSFGILTGWNRRADALLTPLFTAFRSVPPLAWIPLITIWFGTNEGPKILLVFIGCLPAIVVNTYAGISNVSKMYLDVGSMFNANSRQMLFQIAIPSALDAIFAGIRTSTSAAWMVVLAAEMLGSKAGVGFLIVRGMDSLDLPLVLLAMIFIGIVGALLAVVTQVLERIVCPWSRQRPS